jgi:hypothetical protein
MARFLQSINTMQRADVEGTVNWAPPLQEKRENSLWANQEELAERETKSSYPPKSWRF